MKKRFNFIKKDKHPIKIKREPIIDNRGFFERLFCQKEFNNLIKKKNIVQINRAYTKNKATIRGMHYQIGKTLEEKLVTCVKGRVFDVIIDLRKNSKNFLKYKVFILDSSTNNLLIIPKGFAHGFQSLTNNCEIIYCHSETYNPKKELSINPLDPNISINWPLKKPIISSKDLNSQYIYDDFKGIVI